VLVLDKADCTTTISLVYANQTVDDILVREELELLKKSYPDRFNLWYTVDKAPEKWAYSTGFIDEGMLKKHLPAPDAETQIMICGPPPMIKFACLPNLEKIGHKEDNIFVF